MAEYYDLGTTVEEYRNTWQGHGKEICQISVPQALTCFFEGEDFEDVIRNCISIGGDSDTIAAIAGGIAEAFYGVPEKHREKALQFLDPELRDIVAAFDTR
jgi:ADP-ribosylglycohydrolase